MYNYIHLDINIIMHDLYEHKNTHIYIHIDTNVHNLVVSPKSEGGQIHLNPAAILLRPTLHLERQSASSPLKPTFTLSSSTCFLHVLFGLPFFLWPSTSKSNALLNTWPHQQTLFAIANWSIASFKPSMNIKSVELFPSLSSTPHFALTMDLSNLHKFPIIFFFSHNVSLPYSIAGLT